MSTDLDYGPCLTGEEYDKRVVKLHANLPPTITLEMERQVRRQELEISIDYRLGCQFPKDRREKLWEVQQAVERKRVRLIFGYLVRRMFSKLFVRSAQNLAGYLVSEYAKVLSPEELGKFFGEDEVRNPSLPIEGNK